MAYLGKCLTLNYEDVSLYPQHPQKKAWCLSLCLTFQSWGELGSEGQWVTFWELSDRLI